MDSTQKLLEHPAVRGFEPRDPSTRSAKRETNHGLAIIRLLHEGGRDACGDKQGRHSAARFQRDIPLTGLPRMHALSKSKMYTKAGAPL